MTQPRGRYAPSPTGHMTVGNAYTALRAWLDVRSRGGAFVLRIEDSDPSRTQVSSADVMSELALMGLDWDEGPDVGGEHAPYLTSERSARHQQVGEALVAGGHAYWDYTPPIDDVEGYKQKRGKGTDAAYRGSPEPVAGVEPVLRLRVDDAARVEVHDRIFGDVSARAGDIGEVALLRADGRPTYHLASTVDDVDMAITSVVRGADWLNFLPQHVLLFRALEADLPEFAHVPLLLGNDGQKLSKRHGDLSIRRLLGDEGLPPEPVATYLANLGFPERSDLLTLDELADDFDISGMNRASPRFDPKKLNRVVRTWMSEREPQERLLAEMLRRSQTPGLTEADALVLAPGVRSRISSYTDAANLTAFLGLDDEPGRDPEMVPDGVVEEILATDPWAAEALEAVVGTEFDALGDARKAGLMGMRDALAPEIKVSPPLHYLLAALGRDRARARLRAAESSGG